MRRAGRVVEQTVDGRPALRIGHRHCRWRARDVRDGQLGVYPGVAQPDDEGVLVAECPADLFLVALQQILGRGGRAGVVVGEEGHEFDRDADPSPTTSAIVLVSRFSRAALRICRSTCQ